MWGSYLAPIYDAPHAWGSRSSAPPARQRHSHPVEYAVVRSHIRQYHCRPPVDFASGREGRHRGRFESGTSHLSASALETISPIALCVATLELVRDY